MFSSVSCVFFVGLSALSSNKAAVGQCLCLCFSFSDYNININMIINELYRPTKVDSKPRVDTVKWTRAGRYIATTFRHVSINNIYIPVPHIPPQHQYKIYIYKTQPGDPHGGPQRPGSLLLRSGQRARSGRKS